MPFSSFGDALRDYCSPRPCTLSVRVPCLSPYSQAWEMTEFVTINHREQPGVFILGGLDEILMVLEDNQVSPLALYLGGRVYRERKLREERGIGRKRAQHVRRPLLFADYLVSRCGTGESQSRLDASLIFFVLGIPPGFAQVTLQTMMGSRFIMGVRDEVRAEGTAAPRFRGQRAVNTPGRSW